MKNIEAEEAVIGSVLIDPGAHESISQFLWPEDFREHKNRWIWEAFSSIRAKGAQIDFLTTVQEVENNGHLDEMGGAAYITSLITASATSLNAEAYARAVKDCSIRGMLLDTATKIAQSANNLKVPVETGIFQGMQALDSLSGQSSTHAIERLEKFLPEVYTEIEEHSKNPRDIWGIPTGLPKFDNETGGQHGGELTILAGEPAAGKTWLALSFAREMAKNSPGVFFTLEMSEKKLVYRLISGESGLRAKQLQTGRISTEDDWNRLVKSISSMEELPFYIDGRSKDTGTLRAALSHLSRRRGVKWFVLDYLMLLEDPGKDETEKTAIISRALKNMCTGLNIAGFVLHSVVKAGMDREGTDAAAKSFMRGSGQIIHDADLILFLTQYAPDNNLIFYTEEEKKRMATMWVKKGRELEDPRLKVHLVRKYPSPFFGELN